MQSTEHPIRLSNKLEREIVKRLIREAAPAAIGDFIKKNPSCIHISVKRPPEGSAKDAVFIVQLELRLPLVVMIDSTHNLVKELEKRQKIPDFIKNWIPSVYLARRVGPYTTAAVIEHVGKSVTQLIANGGADPLSLLSRAFREWNDLYTSTRIKGELDLERLYIDWMLHRTKDAGLKDNEFQDILERGLVCNGEYKPPLGKCIEEIRLLTEKLQPGFTTFMHGDMWPSGWIVHPQTNKIYLIDWDPYHEPRGDYLYDEAKIEWYLRTTTNGLDAIPSDPFIHNQRRNLKVDLRKENNDYVADYSLQQPSWVSTALVLHSENLRRLATAMDDASWQARYELTLGATFIGLTRKAILRYNDLPCAAMLYAMGVDHLQNCITLHSEVR